VGLGVPGLQQPQPINAAARAVASLEWFGAGICIALALIFAACGFVIHWPTRSGTVFFVVVAILWLGLAKLMSSTAHALWTSKRSWPLITSAFLLPAELFAGALLAFLAWLIPTVALAVHRSPDGQVHIARDFSFSSSSSLSGGTGSLGPTAGFLIGVFLFAAGFHYFQRSRLVLDKPFSKVRSAALGLVELKGRAVGPYVMRSPITQQPSFYYCASISVYDRNNEVERFVQEAYHVPFFLQDDTGMVLMDPNHADIQLQQAFYARYEPSMLAAGKVVGGTADLLRRHAVPSGRPVMITEFCLKPNDPLFVLGTLATNTDLSAASDPHVTLGRSGYIAPKQAAQGGQLMFPAVGPAAASQSAAAAAAPVASASGATTLPSVQKREFPEKSPTVVRSAQDRPYIISWRGREEVAQRFRMWTVVCLLLGPAIAIFSLWSAMPRG
jgi:hypothetical protein